MDVRPLHIEFDPAVVSDLQSRLEAVRWPSGAAELNREGRAGVADELVRDLVTYWRDAYDWPGAQDELNERDHRVVTIEGEDLHVVVFAAAQRHGPPLLLLHGWPGSFVEFLDAAPLLAEAGHDVVVPSLPGFALSDPPRAPGMHGGRMAERLDVAMRSLGFDRYGVQGGDWGAVVALALASRFPDRVGGVHLNLIPDARRPAPGTEMTDEEAAWWSTRAEWDRAERAYYTLQATKPHTLAYALADSPVGLLAWMLEKFCAWSDNDGDLWSVLDRDRLLTNVMLYWLPNRVLSSARVYYEMERAAAQLIPEPVHVPVGYLRMPKEMFAPPRVVVERMFDLVHFTEAAVGGHFAAMEQPRAFATDVARFFSRLGEPSADGAHPDGVSPR